jgi:hypothetical protein
MVERVLCMHEAQGSIPCSSTLFGNLGSTSARPARKREHLSLRELPTLLTKCFLSVVEGYISTLGRAVKALA